MAHRRYFYGIRVQVATTGEGVPVEFAFLPGSASDVRGLEVLPLDLPAGSELFMDSGYTDYAAEVNRVELQLSCCIGPADRPSVITSNGDTVEPASLRERP